MGGTVGKIALGAAIIGAAFLTGGASIGASLTVSTLGVTSTAAATLYTTAIGSVLLTAGSAQILSGAAGALAKRPEITAAQISRLNLNTNPAEPLKTAFGTTALTGDVRYQEWAGPDQDITDIIVAHASHRIAGLDEIWIDNELAWTRDGGVQGKFAGYFFCNTFEEGGPDVGPDLESGKWTKANSRLTGCAYSHLRFKLSGNSKKAESPFASGVPTRMTFVGRGALVYDPRRDSTVPGGSGPMRADDQSTWAFEADGQPIGNNLALQVLRYYLGWRINGKLATGCGLPKKRLDMAAFIEAANLCDEMVAIAAGGSEHRYHGGGVVSEADDPRTVVDMFCAGCNGRMREFVGKLALTIAHNDLAEAATDDGLNDDDVMGAFTWNPDPSLEAAPNVVSGKYTDPSTRALFQMAPYAAARLDSPDGIERIFPLELPVVQSPSHGERVSSQVLERKQYERSFVAPFDIRAWNWPVGKLVPFTFAALGFNRKLFRVVDQELADGGLCVMTLREENAAIYAWDGGNGAPVTPAEPNVYDRRNSPLIRAIDDAGGTAVWGGISGAGKPQDYADVTTDVLENGRFRMAGKAARIATEIRPRFDPLFWTANFPNTMMASVRASAEQVQLDAVFHRKDHLAGLIWESVDNLDHPTTSYDTNRNYRGCKLSFRLQLAGDVLPLDDINGPVLTIEGRKSNGTANTWYVRLGNAATSGTPTDAQIELDFDDLPGGFYGADSVYVGDIDRMFISLVPSGYDAGGGNLAAPREGSITLSNMVATGTAATIVCGLGPGGVHEVRMANGYDDTYNVAPARILRNLQLLGYKKTLNHYVGMSHYFRWAWNADEKRFVAQDVPQPLNTPCTLWHANLAMLLHGAGMQLILSLSYEMLDQFMPRAWRQMDSTGAPALTGWAPPSSLFSPCNAAGMDYLRRVARQFAGIAAAAGLDVHFQVGEPWWWVDFRTRVPCFYDAATTEAYQSETGQAAPVITTMDASIGAAQRAYLDWLGGKLAASVLNLVASVRADHPAMTSYALLYLPQILDEAMPEVKRANMPTGLAYPALDVLQVEDYDFVLLNRGDLSATGRGEIEARLGYPRSKQHYFAGFALFKDTGPIWRYTSNALQSALDWGVLPVFVWAYTQVLRDGYVPMNRSAPPLAIADMLDVDLNGLAPADGDVIYYSAARGRWVAGKPWAA